MEQDLEHELLRAVAPFDRQYLTFQQEAIRTEMARRSSLIHSGRGNA